MPDLETTGALPAAHIAQVESHRAVRGRDRVAIRRPARARYNVRPVEEAVIHADDVVAAARTIRDEHDAWSSDFHKLTARAKARLLR